MVSLYYNSAPHKNLEDNMQNILLDLNDMANIEASAVISKDGLVIASLLPEGMNEDDVGAMSAAMLSVANHSSHELIGGEFKQLLVKGEHGYIFINRVCDETVLTAVTKLDSCPDNVFLNLQQSADKLFALS
jgi:predicted regulator of Ras-like GTPase activity (Roadblock/LC7/MglB family)